MRVSRYTCIVGALMVLLACGAASSTSAIAYRWQTPHVTMAYEDTVGTPAPPSFGFRADLQDLGHKKRLAESFMAAGDTGLIGDRLDINVSLFGTQGRPAGMVLKGRGTTAAIAPPFTDERFVYALQSMRESGSPVIPGQLSSEQRTRAGEVLRRFPDDGFPVLSPGGTRATFLSWRSGSPDAYATSLDSARSDRLGATRSTSAEPIAYTHGILRVPSWSPAGQMVAYIPDGRVAVVRASEGGRLVSPPDATISAMEWSPDARHIAGVVGAMEQNVDLAQGVMLLDPACARGPVSLGDALPIFRYGDFPTRTGWSPDSRTLAVMVNTNGAVRDTEQVRQGRGVLYLVDASSYGSRSVDLSGDVLDYAWDCRGDALAVVVRPRGSGRSSLVYVNRRTGAQRVYYSTSRNVIILGVSGGRIAFLEDAVPRVASPLGVGRIAGARVEVLPLVPGYYGGYHGSDTEYRTTDELASTVIAVEESSTLRTQFPCLPRRIIKDYVTILIVPRGTFDRSWTRSFVDEYDIVWLDWSPGSGIIATSSPNGGCFRMLQVLPDRRVVDITDRFAGVDTVDQWRECGQRIR